MNVFNNKQTLVARNEIIQEGKKVWQVINNQNTQKKPDAYKDSNWPGDIL